MFNKKIGIIVVLAAIMALSMINVGYAAVACTFDLTATTAGTRSTYLIGSALNLTGTATAQSPDGLNVTVATLTNDVTGTVHVFNKTDGVNESNFNATVNTAEFVDTATVTFTFTLKNVSQDVVATCTRSYIMDNSVPVHTSLSPDDDVRVTSDAARRNFVFSVTCTNASSATLFIDGFSHTATESGDLCTYTKDFLSDGGHIWRFDSSDGLNTTIGTERTIEISVSGGGNYAPMPPAGSGAGTSGGTGLAGTSDVVKMAIVGIAAYLIYQKTSGGKSKKGSRSRKKR